MAEAALHGWLTIVGMQDGGALAWEALKKEAGLRLDPIGLDDAMQTQESRPVAVDQLLLNGQGRAFVLKLFVSARAQSDYGGLDFLRLCLRQIAILGHARELFEEENLTVSEDFHLFDLVLVDISRRAKDAMQTAEPWLLGWQAKETVAMTAENMQCACGSRDEAQCYVLQFLKTLAAGDAKDSNLWFGSTHHSGWVVVPEMIGCHPLRSMVARLSGAALQFVEDTSWISLRRLASAYSTHPCAAFLREPLVMDRLYAVAFDPRLASEATIQEASFLIAEAAVSPWSESSTITADAASTAAAVAACGRHCHDAGTTASNWQTLLSLSSEFPAARHGVTFWLKCCLVDPDWLSVHYSSTLLCLLKRYATYPQSQRDVFEVLKLVATASAECEGKHHLGDAYTAALLALADLAAIWRGAPQIFLFFDHSRNIDARQLRLLIVHLANKVSSPFALWFARATASLLSCKKATKLWHDLDLMPHAEQHALLNLSGRIADNFE